MIEIARRPAAALPPRSIAESIARARPHADVAALVRASLDELRRSESALEEQLGHLRDYLGAAGLGDDLRQAA